jgi:preprotein translocase subunit SecD
MIIYYRLPGLLATVALIIYTIIIYAVHKLIPITLTLSGIAGFILSIGLAVDANVLIFARLKEEFAQQTFVATGC